MTREIKIGKVTVNIGVGETGEKLDKAFALLKELVEQQPVKTKAREKNPTWGLREGLPIGTKVTLRKQNAEKFLTRALAAVDNRLRPSCFDDQGNVSFGIEEYIQIPDVKYDPKIGMYGMNVSITLEPPGIRIKKRRKQRSKVPPKHRVSKQEAMDYMKKNYKVEISDDVGPEY